MEKDIFDSLALNSVNEILFGQKSFAKPRSFPSFPSFSSLDSAASRNSGSKSELSTDLRNMRCKDATDFLSNKAPLIVREIEQHLAFESFKAEASFLSAKPIEELQNEKSRVKRQLSLYDEEFRLDMARLPSEKEKVPMKAFYLYYKRLKQALDRRTANDSPAETQKARVEVAKRLEELQARKKVLNQALFAFQKSFESTAGRAIRHAKDLLPVEAEYKEYKAVKADISVLKSWLDKKV